MDDGGTPMTEGRWLTYAELAEFRGITRKESGAHRSPGSPGGSLEAPAGERHSTSQGPPATSLGGVRGSIRDLDHRPHRCRRDHRCGELRRKGDVSAGSSR